MEDDKDVGDIAQYFSINELFKGLDGFPAMNAIAGITSAWFT